MSRENLEQWEELLHGLQEDQQRIEDERRRAEQEITRLMKAREFEDLERKKTPPPPPPPIEESPVWEQDDYLQNVEGPTINIDKMGSYMIASGAAIFVMGILFGIVIMYFVGQ